VIEITDADGGKWHPVVLAENARRIQDEIGLTVLAENATMPDPKTIGAQLLTKLEIFPPAFYLCVQRECAEREISRDDAIALFGRGPMIPMIQAITDAMSVFLVGSGTSAEKNAVPVKGGDGV